YKQDIDYTWSATQTKVYSRIEGLQWSLNTGLGVNYKIQKDLSLFFEPKMTFYLDNNQPMSARTENPLVIGLNGGLRIEL
ncbi:MAG: outer membrane protein beta-barrel domain, partial [Bacteroidetes bacterium]|nr:outer membrane protein beta-barrel domain [Bacteroidota bacterium]